MGYMESAVAIYLREIYYPNGFQFPLIPIEANIGLVELIREAATIIVLLGIGILSAKTTSLRFAGFIYSFAIWDLFYYIFLWIFLGWPESFFTWDLLFLIPVPWVGPVITPCIVSITMIFLSLSIFYAHNVGLKTALNAKEWGLFGVGSILIILSFIWDYLKYIHNEYLSIPDDVFSGKHDMLYAMKDYVPNDFNWSMFLAGESILIYGIIIFINRIRIMKAVLSGRVNNE